MINEATVSLDCLSGSSLLLVNSSDSEDGEDHEGSILAAVRAGAIHPHHQELLQDHHSRSHSTDRLAGLPPGSAVLSQHDPFSRAPAPPGSDVVDELLKPLQSYFNVFRTGQYTGGGLDDLVNGGPPAHNTRSQADKRYKIKKEHERKQKRGERVEHVENGHLPPHLAMMGAPPPMTNGYHLDTADLTHMPPPNMTEPPPNMVPVAGQPPLYPPPHIQHPLLIPPPVLLSSSPGSPPAMYPPVPGAGPPPDTDHSNNDNLDLDISKMSLAEKREDSEMVTDNSDFPPRMDTEQLTQLLTKDLFNLYSLSFLCKSKDLSERRIRLDFGLVAEVRIAIIFDF